MKALSITDVKKFSIIEKEISEAVGNKVVIKVKKAGICGSDIHMMWQTGYNAGTNFIIGHEFCGEIYDAGNSGKFKKGDRVVAMEIDSCLECDYCKNNQEELCDHVLEGGPGIGTDGGYAEYVAVREDMVLPLPDEVSFLEGAMVEPAAISLHGLNIANVTKDSTILITGGGTIGLFAAACAHALGVEKIALIEVNEEKIKLAQSLGYITKVFNGLDQNLDSDLKKLYPNGFDAVIECSGAKSASTIGLNNLKKGCTMSLIAYGEYPEIDLFNFINNERSLKGSLFFTRSEFSTVIKLMAEKKLDLKPFAKLIPMEDVQKTLEDITSGKENKIKYIIDIDN